MMRFMGRTRVRRRRIVALGAWLAIASLAVGPVGHALTADASARRVPAVSYVVQQGDTLWSLAGRLAPQEDPREVVARIEAANRLGVGSSLQPGRALVVPLP
jgi:nucleoid-associated protein YgaU